MKKITKWRLMTVLLLSFFNIIGGLISYFFTPESLILIVVICLGIEASIKYIDKYLIAPKLKEFEEKEKTKEGEKEKELKKYNSIKRIIILLEKYEDFKNDEREEIECIQELGEIFPKLAKIKFRFSGNTTIKDNNYEVIFKPRPLINKFLIRKLKNGMRVKPYEEYFSKEYPQSETDQSNSQVLYDFVKYLKEKINLFDKSYIINRKKEKENYKEIQRKCINALHNICSYGFTYPISANIKDTGIIISSLNLLKTYKDLIQSLDITYIEKDVKKLRKTGFLGTYMVNQIFVYVECENSLEINLDIKNFDIDEFNKLKVNGSEVEDYLEISQVFTCLANKIKHK